MLGLVAGYLRGKVDELVGIVLDALLSIPALVLLLAIAAIGSRNATTLIIGLSIFLTAPFARLVRANTISLADREFVLAARAMGATRGGLPEQITARTEALTRCSPSSWTWPASGTNRPERSSYAGWSKLTVTPPRPSTSPPKLTKSTSM